MGLNLQEVLCALEVQTGHKPRRHGDNFVTLCPAHDDHRPSLSVREGDDGKILVHCFVGCPMRDIFSALEIEAPESRTPSGNGKNWTGREIETVYDYRNESGELLFQKVRMIGKGFSQRRPDGHGHWIWGLAEGEYVQKPSGDWVRAKDSDNGMRRQFGSTRQVIYRLPETERAVAYHKMIYIAEGEKDVDRLVSLGLNSTTWPGGASAKWSSDFSAILRDAHVFILPDNDEPGLQQAIAIANSLCAVDAHVAIVGLPGLLPKGDVSDWLDAGGTKEELQQICRDTPEYDPDNPPPSSGDGTSPDTDPEDDDEIFTERQNAKRFAEHFGENIKHSTTQGWLYYNGKHWDLSAAKEAQECAKQLNPIIMEEWKEEDTDSEGRLKAYKKAARSSSRAAGIRATLQLASSEPQVNADNIILDSDAMLFNVENGTVELRCRTLREHRAADFLSAMCPTSYVPDAKCPRFDRFMDEIFNRDPELISYVWWVISRCITGWIDDHVFFIFLGGGRNGKSTLIETLLEILGPAYRYIIPTEELLLSNNDRHPTGRAGLRGKRVVIASEFPQGRRLNESFIKKVVAGDTIEGRHMGKDFFEFKPQCTLIIQSNHAPVIKDTSKGMWDRVRLIPFDQVFEGDRKIIGLTRMLLQEAEGILAKAISLAPLVYQGEPPIPDSVRTATSEYQRDSDEIGLFFEENCIVDSNATVPKSRLFETYIKWSSKSALSRVEFNRRIAQMEGVKTRRMNTGERWEGIKLFEFEFFGN